MKKQLLQLLLLVNIVAQAQYTLIPDPNFEQHLISIGADTVIDGKVETSVVSILDFLNIPGANITSLEGIQDFVSLTRLDCYNNNLTSLDVTKLVNLALLQCDENEITSLDLSKNPNLYFLKCNNNRLTYVNLKSGNNTELDTYSFYLSFKSNPNLACIEVDDAAHSSVAWKDSIDEGVTIFSENCITLGVQDAIFAKLIVSPNPSKGIVHIENISLETATVYDAMGRKVSATKFNKALNNYLDLSHLGKGLYYTYLESQGATVVREIILN